MPKISMPEPGHCTRRMWDAPPPVAGCLEQAHDLIEADAMDGSKGIVCKTCGINGTLRKPSRNEPPTTWLTWEPGPPMPWDA